MWVDSGFFKPSHCLQHTYVRMYATNTPVPIFPCPRNSSFGVTNVRAHPDAKNNSHQQEQWWLKTLIIDAYMQMCVATCIL